MTTRFGELIANIEQYLAQFWTEMSQRIFQIRKSWITTGMESRLALCPVYMVQFKERRVV